MAIDRLVPIGRPNNGFINGMREPNAKNISVFPNLMEAAGEGIVRGRDGSRRSILNRQRRRPFEIIVNLGGCGREQGSDYKEENSGRER